MTVPSIQNFQIFLIVCQPHCIVAFCEGEEGNGWTIGIPQDGVFEKKPPRKFVASDYVCDAVQRRVQQVLQGPKNISAGSPACPTARYARGYFGARGRPHSGCHDTLHRVQVEKTHSHPGVKSGAVCLFPDKLVWCPSLWHLPVASLYRPTFSGCVLICIPVRFLDPPASSYLCHLKRFFVIRESTNLLNIAIETLDATTILIILAERT